MAVIPYHFDHFSLCCFKCYMRFQRGLQSNKALKAVAGPVREDVLMTYYESILSIFCWITHSFLSISWHTHWHLVCSEYVCSGVSLVQVILNKLHLCLSQQHMKHASYGCWVFIFRLVLELPLHKVPGQAMFLRLAWTFNGQFSEIESGLSALRSHNKTCSVNMLAWHWIPLWILYHITETRQNRTVRIDGQVGCR